MASGLQSYCKPCVLAYEREKYGGSCRKPGARSRYYRQTYGLTLEQLDELAERQGRRCAICSKESQLVVDHDHDTGEIRGLLCPQCNRCLGLFQDNVGLLVAATMYLMAAKDVLVEAGGLRG
ncbi:endonuclease VII domain-containing protein [Amycolatopsis sp. NPDC021455]|uniref:endonuclease VII domain-containing protein n=1 Tax=Amycolatopsis sp. NPDC021455 TaxID=3154901 RepID=UPI0033DA369D